MLFTSISRPRSSFGAGNPSVDDHFEAAYVWPCSEDVCSSFCHSEEEEKHIRTLIVLPACNAFAESFRNVSFKLLRVSERAQKQVTRMTLLCASKIAGKILER